MQPDKTPAPLFPASSVKAALTYNAAVGKLSEFGQIDPLEKFIAAMRPQQVNSFMGSTVHVVQLSEPLTVFRAGPIGRFWCTGLPLSPWQQSIDLAMSPYIYSDYAMKQIPNWLPVNQGVLIYEIPANTVFAFGDAAPQFGWPGQTNQIYLSRIEPEKIKAFSWKQFKQNPVQEWAKQIVSPNSVPLEYEMTPFPWRPAISESVRVSWFKRFDYRAMGSAMTKIAVPPLVALDIYSRYQQENISHPDFSLLAKGSAITAGVGLDLGSFFIMTVTTSPNIAACVVLGVNYFADKAHELGYIPPEKFINDRQFLLDHINALELSPHAEKFLLDDFDNGGKISRDFNLQMARTGNEIRKKFSGIYDAKQAIISVFRETGEWVNGKLKSKENTKNLLAFSDSLSYQDHNKNQGLTDIFNSVDYKASHLQSMPKLAMARMSLRLNSRDISLIKTENSLIFNVPVNHQITTQNSINLVPDSAKIQPSSASVELKTTRKPLPRQYLSGTYPLHTDHQITTKKSLISDIRLGPAGGGIGIIATLAQSGSVSFSVNSSGFLVYLSADFGPGFFSALSAGTGIAVVVAGVVLTAQYLYRKGAKHIDKKIKNSIRNSQINSQIIANALIDFSRQLESESNTNISELIHQGQCLINSLTTNIKQEEESSKYARNKRRYSAGVKHNSVAMSLQHQLNDVSKVNTSLLQAQVQETFINENKNKTAQEMIQLAESFKNKETYTQQDVSKIKGLRQLIVNNALKLSGDGKFEEAQTLLNQTSHLKYYLPGDMPEIQFGEAFGHLDEATQKDIVHINTKLSAVDEMIGSGRNPIESLNDLSADLSEIIKSWGNREARRGHKKNNSKYVTKEQWLARANILRELTKTLNDKIIQYSHGNHASDMNLSSLSDLLQQLTQTKREPDFWLSEYREIHDGKKSFSEEELMLFKAISSHYLINAVFSLASQGEFEQAKIIIQKLALNVSEYQTLSEQYIHRLDELKPLLPLKADDWMKRVQNIHKLSEDKKNDADTLELVVAEQFILNDIFSQAGQGNLTQAKNILEKFKDVLPDKKNLATHLISKIENLEPQYHDVDACLELLKNSYQKPAESLDLADLLEQKIVNNVILSNILSQIMAGEYTKANTLCEDYPEAAPDKTTNIKIFQSCIQELTELKDHNNDILLKRLGTVNDIPRLKEEIITANIENWILQNIFNSVSAGEYREAKNDLEKLGIQDGSQNGLCIQLIEVLDQAQHNSGQDEFFWQNTFEKHFDALSNNTKNDSQTAAVHNMGKIVAVRAALNIAGKRSASGFNGEAAEILKHLNTYDKKLNLKNLEEDFHFAHQGQLIGIFTKPGQTILASYINGCNPSALRTTMQSCLTLLNTIQTAVPNALPLGLQMGHAYLITGNMPAVSRSIGNIYDQLSKDLNPYDADFNPLNPANQYNGAMIYGQLVLKAVQYLPLSYLVPEKKIEQVEKFRHNAVYYGHLAARGISTGYTVSHLIKDNPLKTGFFSNANTPVLLANATNAGLDLGYWAYHKYLESKGQSSEKISHYITQNALGNIVEGLGMVAFARVISKNKWLNVSAALLASGNVLYHLFSRSGHTEAAQRALISAISNINHHQKYDEHGLDSLSRKYIEKSCRSIENILNSNFEGFTYDKNQPEVANIARIIHFSESLKFHFNNKNYNKINQMIHVYSVENNSFINSAYQFPPHLVWQPIIAYGLLSFAQNIDSLSSFRAQYQLYSHIIDDSSKESKNWYENHINTIKDCLKQILSFAFQQFIIAADKAKTADDKLIYLGYLTQSYYFFPLWHEVLQNDELKFWAAYLYFTLDKKQECELFLHHIYDLPGLIRNKQQADFTQQALLMLEDMDAKSHLELLTRPEREQFALEDSMIAAHFFKLLAKKDFTSADYLLNHSADFRGKTTALAAYRFESSNRTQVLTSLKKLVKEQNKDLAYWFWMYEILSKCISCTQYVQSHSMTKEQAMLFGLIQICIDYIQSFSIPHELSVEISHMSEYVRHNIKQFVLYNSYSNVDEKIEQLLEKGHQCLRGEETFNLIAEVQKILHSASFTYIENNIKHSYLPMHYIDRDCLGTNFRIFNIDSKGFLYLSNPVIMKEEGFEIIEVLEVGADNYIQLIKLDLPVVEVIDLSYINDNMFFKKPDSKSDSKLTLQYVP